MDDGVERNAHNGTTCTASSEDDAIG